MRVGLKKKQESLSILKCRTYRKLRHHHSQCKSISWDELDSGTAFEIGYGIALGKRVVLYMDDTRDYKEKLTCKKDENQDKDGCS